MSLLSSKRRGGFAHRVRRFAATVLWIAAVFAGPSSAQALRYELGLRLRALEVSWESASADDKARALPELQTAVSDFFRLRLSTAARGLDRARLVLLDMPTDGPTAWCAAFAVRPERQFAATAGSDGSLVIGLAPLYATEIAVPEDATASLRLMTTDGVELARASVELLGAGEFEARLALADLPAGDHHLLVQWHVGEKLALTRRVGCSLARDAESRVDAARARLSAEPPASRIEAATAERLTVLLERALSDEVAETDHPYTRLLGELEAVLALEPDQRLYDRRTAGEFWLRVPSGERETDVRIFVPPSADDALRPCVIALHGAGGSDNLFFDGYGDGAAVRLAAERGWVLITPRAPLFGNVDVEGVLEALAERYGIDRGRVCLLGHSMGAVQALGAAKRSAESFAAMALIGGGRASRDDERCAQVPAYIAAGSEDFALAGARALHASLTELGATPRLDVRQGIEHLTIVQESLAAAFRFFDEVGAEPGGR